MSKREQESKVLRVVQDIIDREDFSSDNFRRDFRPDRDEHGNIIGLRNGKHYAVRNVNEKYRKLHVEKSPVVEALKIETGTLHVGKNTIIHERKRLNKIDERIVKTETAKSEVEMEEKEEKESIRKESIREEGEGLKGVENEVESYIKDAELGIDIDEDEGWRDKEASSSLIPNPPTRITRVVKYNHEAYNWSEIRKHYVIGRRLQLEDGSWVSEDYSLKELSQKFGVSYAYLRAKSAKECWGKIRKAYLARVNQINIGQELGLYTQENYQAEISAMNACNKLGVVLDKYIDHKFGAILDSNEDIHADSSEVESLFTDMLSTDNQSNRTNSTVPLISELKDAIKVATDIYNLQRKIYENAPKPEIEVIERITNKPKFKNEKERQAKIQQLQAKLSSVLKPNEFVETFSQSTVETPNGSTPHSSNTSTIY